MDKPNLGEPDAHVMMRHAKTILRFLLILALITTSVLLLFLPQAAYLAASAVLVLFIGFVIVSYLERQSQAKVLRSRNQSNISQKEVEMDVQYAGIYTAIALTLFLALGVLILAATLVEDWSMVGMVAAVFFLMSVFLLFPFIPLFIREAKYEERDKLQHEAELHEEPKK
ncbi:hypothetical protein [Gimesia sp.]|uniref:hypothetical protein n=1 Tax=Gimesia sp. TaxID=2024833 RepID=UPI000C5793A4|nr:hypothetical protein [Gimesia sp.]MAX40350.1 hypothetical protein [Gimesia sp.]HAH43753.1 hypothetical protein [Planctomycetaceae bacterium]HBL43179.1 hypothetical protein [Planctomycetaceae bacterium]|tara:strand:+ start:3799 stop:4308 length:510 start_codon:yes stop_codon:yes gene_type:complete